MSKPTHSRQHDAARKLSREFGVFVEFAPVLLGGTYVVETRMAGDLRAARKMAREMAAQERARFDA